MAVVDLLDMHKQFLLSHIRVGGTVADFTMGNGHDTAWLANAVGPLGHVYAFDIQEQAVENTRQRLASEGLLTRCTLVHDSHANALSYIHEPICAGVFNLGWLPGGDHSVHTMRESTKVAVHAALTLCDKDGIILIAVYPGHEEGTAEGCMLSELLATIDRRLYSVTRFEIINSPTSPYFFAAERTTRELPSNAIPF